MNVRLMKMGEKTYVLSKVPIGRVREEGRGKGYVELYTGRGYLIGRVPALPTVAILLHSWQAHEKATCTWWLPVAFTQS